MSSIKYYRVEKIMEFDKTKGFCNGLNIKDTSCEFTSHLLKHAHDEVTAKNCKKCTCPAAKGHKRQYAAKRREMVG
jgi:hypothetical protein